MQAAVLRDNDCTWMFTRPLYAATAASRASLHYDLVSHATLLIICPWELAGNVSGSSCSRWSPVA